MKYTGGRKPEKQKRAENIKHTSPLIPKIAQNAPYNNRKGIYKRGLQPFGRESQNFKHDHVSLSPSFPRRQMGAAFHNLASFFLKGGWI